MTVSFLTTSTAGVVVASVFMLGVAVVDALAVADALFSVVDAIVF